MQMGVASFFDVRSRNRGRIILVSCCCDIGNWCRMESRRRMYFAVVYEATVCAYL